MAAVLEPNGAAASGQQPAGVVAQYQIDAVDGNADAAGVGVTPYDSGTILGTVPPGKAGLKLVNGTVQRASQIVADATPGVVGNALVSSYSQPSATVGSGIPVPPTGSRASDGLSLSPERE